jgi:formate dehydrogenase major subunit
LTAARELARLGHRVTVLEKHERPGGMLNQGIPAFRLPRDHIEREIDQIMGMGVEIRCAVTVGAGVTLEDLASQHDAVIMAAGTLRPNLPPLAGSDLAGVEHGLKFLLEVNEAGRRDIGRKVVVIGGGYTAMDCARTALRLDADEVTVAYRRARADMVVLPGELEEYLAEGGRLENECAPVAFLGGANRVRAVRFVRTRAGEPGRDGRRLPLEIPDSRFDVQADAVILATGQFPDTGWIGFPLRGRLVAKDQWLSSSTAHHTGHPKIFVAGDFALGPTTLIQAIGHAKECALKVDWFLAGTSRVGTTVRVSASFQSKAGARRSTGRTASMNTVPLHPMPTLPSDRRGLEDEVESGYDEAQALMEASRCYLCHYKFEIIDAKCVLCDECLLVKPVPGCIVEIADLLRDAEGCVTGYVPVQEGKTDSLYYNRLWIDQNQCVRCGRCEAACPVNAITIQQVTLERAYP